MSKRSNFERIDRDRYNTPFPAVLPLILYLQRDGVTSFAEPCAGDGELIRHLELFGLTCAYRGDIATGQDALKLTIADLNGAIVITNPPYRRPEDQPRTTRLLFDLIRHLLSLGAPFWLLLSHDWSTNKGSARYLKYCTDVVVIGRVKWIPGSEHEGGYENASWYRFDINHSDGPRLRNDRSVAINPTISVQGEAA